ncbi:MAG: zinc ABC transporter substrate-binding protein [Deltaproteobacteria bacterium]|nr:zinc ABC transporter substrate-binding protein [bacterium]MCB9479151.1 zinc ABC transporter substrate-binding protein [Deltaproteobacteria bacterium]MCB9489178.1 zinc ABC transporter substrate-binding protein [Deltaproteobacteria bacterium]
MRRSFARWAVGVSALALCLILAGSAAAQDEEEAPKPRIGVTLHPYYSWVRNIVGDKMDVVPIIPANADPHSYQPRPVDLANLKGLSAIVVNNLGHDEFIKPMLKSAGQENLKQIEPNRGVPLIKIHIDVPEGEDASQVAYNSHSYLSITSGTQQIANIAQDLGSIDPDNADFYRANARSYSKRLRRLLGNALAEINKMDTSKASIASVHDGYSYILQELGLNVVAVIQPRHGIEPNPRQLQDTIKRIKTANANILFTELDYDKKYVDIITAETGCKLYSLSHVSGGEYTDDLFEAKMEKNLNTIVEAVRDTQ